MCGGRERETRARTHTHTAAAAAAAAAAPINCGPFTRIPGACLSGCDSE